MKIEKKSKGNKNSQNGKQAKPIAKADKQNTEKNTKTSLQKLVTKNKNFTFLANGKIKCTLTGHEMEPTRQNFENYLKSKSYKRGVEAQFDLGPYEEILVEHKDHPKFLFCQLTGAKIPMKKTAIEKHVNGKKFLRKLEEAQEEE